MNLNEYQELSIKHSKVRMRKGMKSLMILGLGISGEAGEVSDIIKKVARDNRESSFTPEQIEEFRLELGDVLFYVANLADAVGLSLEEVGQGNIDKLKYIVEREGQRWVK